MKNLLYIFLCLEFLTSCGTNLPNQSETGSLSFEKNEEDEYDIIVLDPQYESYLASIARPMHFYSENYYKSKNRIYVNEWNIRHSQPFTYDPDFYALRIDYDPNMDYGILLEYKLYNFFEFIKWKYKVDLNFSR